MNKTGHPGEAEKRLDQARLMDPGMPLALYELGFIQVRLNRPQRARDCFERYLELGIAGSSSEQVRSIVERLRKLAPWPVPDLRRMLP
jgi:hypothetical protein